jgi:hypothetical protein
MAAALRDIEVRVLSMAAALRDIEVRVYSMAAALRDIEVRVKHGSRTQGSGDESL